MTEQTFKTVLRNEMKKKGAILWDKNGGGLGILGPGCKRELESWNKESLYAPFAEVVFKDDGIVETKENPDYPAPKSRWLLTILNKGGGELERRIIDHREVALPRGLERTFELEPEDPMAVYSRMEIICVMSRSDERNEMFPSYSRFRPVVKDKYLDRPADELMELERELEKLATDIEQ